MPSIDARWRRFRVRLALLVRKDGVEMTKYLLSFNGPIQEKQTNALRDRIALVLEQKDYQSLIVLFSSTGGRSTDGLSLYNFLRSLPRPIQFHAVGSIESMAIPVFCGAHKRTCSPVTRFSFHTYSWGGFEGGKAMTAY